MKKHTTKFLRNREIGELGEKIVQNHFEKLGFVCYKPVTIDVSHPCDNLFTQIETGEMFMGEVKTKEKRIYYPDTGVNIESYRTYKDVKKRLGIPFNIYFVDKSFLI